MRMQDNSKSLIKAYDAIFDDNNPNQHYWWYYPELNQNDFKLFGEYADGFGHRINSGMQSDVSGDDIYKDFITKIYEKGGKDFFLKDLDTDISERSAHMVSAFFLGHHFSQNLNIFQGIVNDSEFPWLWFLCCLYHDAYFKNEWELKHLYLKPQYFSDSKDVLHDEDIIEKYRDMRLSTGKADHGIYAAAALSNHYDELYSRSERNNNSGNELTVDNDTRKAVNCVAKVIASHNIFLAQHRDEEKYRRFGLDALIPSENSNCKMPKSLSGKYDIDKYDILYLLLCLVDILEPIKRQITPAQVFVEITDRKIVLKLADNIDTAARCDYISNILEAERWLNYISVNLSKYDTECNISIEIEDINQL